jgi:hypothetical protein
MNPSSFQADQAYYSTLTVPLTGLMVYLLLSTEMELCLLIR